jgi:ATP-binding cassette, subfamily B, bacterial PglK
LYLVLEGLNLINISAWKKAWALLDMRERRNAWIVLCVMIAAALASATMIGSIMPFLTVLAEPERIHSEPLLAWAYNGFDFSSEYEFLAGLGIAAFAVIIFANLVQILRVWLVARFATMRVHTLSHRLLAAYLRQPYEYFLNNHTGTMSTQILAETQQVVNQFFRPAADFIAALLTVIAIVALLIWVDPAVALIVFGLLGGIYGTIFALSRRMLVRVGKIRTQANSERYRVANEALGGVKDIKLSGRESSYVSRYQIPSLRMARSQVVAAITNETPHFAMQTVAFGGAIILCLVLLDPQSLTSGSALGGILPLLGVFAFAGQRLMPEFSRLYRSLTLLQYNSAAVDVVYDDLVGKTAGGTLPQVPPAPLGLTRELRLDAVHYHYPNANHAGLRDITFTIHAGEKIGVVGSTGAGKTTLADIILGLLRPHKGELVVDGTPLRDEHIRAWQQSVGYVPQEIFLTDASVIENIALGVPASDINPGRVEEAARTARLDSFIREELPHGYDTTIGERGVRLSGGQRQRIGIARALYHDADLIVFDEATSALDNLTEREVMNAIEALPGDKSVIIIAHRLSTVQYCDRIIVLEKGRFAGCGRWDALMHDNPAFRKIAPVT